MKNLILLISVLIHVFSFSQKTEFGITFEGGFPLLSNKNGMIKDLNISQSSPVKSHLIHPNSFWNVEHLMFDIYPKQVPKMSISFGIRLFNFGWKIDTVAITYPDPVNGDLISIYGEREMSRSYGLPTVSIGYNQKLFDNFYIKPFVSIGCIRTFLRSKRSSTAYDANNQSFFDYSDFDYFRFTPYFEGLDLQVGGLFGFEKNGFSSSLGVVYYHFQIPQFGKLSHDGLYLNVGIGYHFSRKVK